MQTEYSVLVQVLIAEHVVAKSGVDGVIGR